jgi:small subunit ribosomal protein S4
MGSPKKQRKKFSKPSHPWQKERILAEQELLKEYGLNRKYEIWKMNSILKNFTRQAKNLITTENPQVEKEKNQLLTKLSSLGLTGKDAKIEDVLSLTLKDIMERRLQTLVFRKNLSSSVSQARQFIVHEHISLGDKTITAPSYLVPLEQEGILQFSQGSAIASTSHPIRVVIKKEKEAKETLVKEKEAEEKKEETKKAEEKAKEKKAKVSKADDLKKEEPKKEAKEKSEEKKE